MSQQFLLPFLVRNGDTVLDIGANTGQFTVPLASHVGASGVVHAFEPICSTFSELKVAVEQNGIATRVKLCNFALGDSARVADFTIPKDRPTEATAVPHRAERWTDFRTAPEKYVTQSCTVVRLDDYLQESDIRAVSFLKCDVEGGEFQVMRGATNLLRGPSPPVLMMEIFKGWTRTFGYEPREIIDFLEKEARYECYWISPTGLKRVRSRDPVIPGIFYQWVDFLFIIPEVHSHRLKVERFSVR